MIVASVVLLMTLISGGFCLSLAMIARDPVAAVEPIRADEQIPEVEDRAG